jgi:hypothetical protein
MNSIIVVGHLPGLGERDETTICAVRCGLSFKYGTFRIFLWPFEFLGDIGNDVSSGRLL